jgi:pyruvate dehydrogenase E1 component
MVPVMATGPMERTFDQADLALLRAIEQQVQWLSTYTIHHANHVRANADGLKVGGHQASCASITTLMTALYMRVLTPRDRVAVKPHASPVFHAIQYLLGRQTRDQLENFRALGGAQSYPSRTKDHTAVDFSTGSVGLGVAITAFASLVQDYLVARDWLSEAEVGRMIALLGDAELDEGNIYEALIEAYKHDVRNVWWVVDYNRQSLDAVTSDRMFTQFEQFFRSVEWEVVTLKYGKRQKAVFAEPGGEALREWIDASENAAFAALTFQGGKAWRERLNRDLGRDARVAKIVARHDDRALAELMTDLGGHCMETLLETFLSVQDDRPRLFIAYTTKGRGLPFQGHKDNHSGLMNPTQLESYQRDLGVPAGAEWEPLSSLASPERARVEAYLTQVSQRHASSKPARVQAQVSVPSAAEFPLPAGEKQATQAAFGKIMQALARTDSELAARIVTTSPDVTVSTNLGGWVNQRGLFGRKSREDAFKQANVLSPQHWSLNPRGQHVELGIAESNLFLNLAAFGLSASLFGQRLFPVGTLYDPFIARGLDALNYGCYQDARFLLVATPSGITLAPEGGAHQSISTPLIGMAQDKLSYFEPAFVDELAEIMRWSFTHMQLPEGGSVYLRLSTRVIEQPARESEAWKAQLLEGAYWHVQPVRGARLAIAYTGALAPEALAAHAALSEDVPGVGLLAVPSPDRIHAGWTASLKAPWLNGPKAHAPSHIERLLSALAPDATLVTVIDGAPAALSWLGSVRGQRVIPLGVEHFGQSGSIDDLYRVYRIGSEAILDACASALLPRATLHEDLEP